MVIITDRAQKSLAEAIARDSPNACAVMLYDGRLPRRLKKLRPCDLLVVLFSFDTYISGANRFLSPFKKPKGLTAKYAFIRPGISGESLQQGLSTPKELIYEKIAQFRQYEAGSKLRVTNAAGTDITLTINSFTTCAYEITEDGAMAFLPPSEVSAEVTQADGKIAVDVTVGQLYYFGELLEQFGLTDEPVILTVKNSMVADIAGGAMAARLKETLFALPPECRALVELGHGLSDMQPTGLIGVDESIVHTCHFGIGDGGKCGLHLDVVIGGPSIEAL